jgi:hypothetical protein
MGLLIQLALNLFLAIIVFVAGILWRKLRVTVLFFRARRFWQPVMSDDLQLVLGGFGDLEGFEASGLVGRGDVLAMNELTAYFQRIGYGTPRISYGDQLGRNDLTGESLRTNMIIIGGPDANSMTRDVIERIKLGIDFVATPSMNSIRAANPASQDHTSPGSGESAGSGCPQRQRCLAYASRSIADTSMPRL